MRRYERGLVAEQRDTRLGTQTNRDGVADVDEQHVDGGEPTSSPPEDAATESASVVISGKKRRGVPRASTRLSGFDAAIMREVIAANVLITDDGCWLWQGEVNRGDYGTFLGRPVHRLSYMAFVGPIPYKYHIDHVCRVRHCCRAVPMGDGSLHLEAVTQEENNRRAMAYIQKYPGERVHHAAQRWCKHGHEFDEENTGIDRQGKRYCKKCRVDNLKRWRREVDGQEPRPREWHVDPERFWANAVKHPRVAGEPILTTAEAATILEIEPKVLVQWAQRHRASLDLPPAAYGRRPRWWPESLVFQLLESRSDEPWSRQLKGDRPLKTESSRRRRRVLAPNTPSESR